ncbi:MAG: transcriptional regulator [Spirochaetales bacterium]|nr:transcriptional regulator [Spirochaetales bacterium]
MTLEESYEDLMKVFAEVESVDDMKALFTDIFTPAEIKDFTIRWKLMNDLMEGKPQRKIASDLRISLCRITRGSKMLKKKEGYVSRLLHDRHDETHR